MESTHIAGDKDTWSSAMCLTSSVTPGTPTPVFQGSQQKRGLARSLSKPCHKEAKAFVGLYQVPPHPVPKGSLCTVGGDPESTNITPQHKHFSSMNLTLQNR